MYHASHDVYGVHSPTRAHPSYMMYGQPLGTAAGGMQLGEYPTSAAAALQRPNSPAPTGIVALSPTHDLPVAKAVRFPVFPARTRRTADARRAFGTGCCRPSRRVNHSYSYWIPVIAMDDLIATKRGWVPGADACGHARYSAALCTSVSRILSVVFLSLVPQSFAHSSSAWALPDPASSWVYSIRCVSRYPQSFCRYLRFRST